MEGCIKRSTNLMRMNKFDDEEECLQYLIDNNLIIEKNVTVAVIFFYEII